MPINSSSIPALRAARAAKRRRRAEGGSVFPEDIKRVHIRSDAPAGADESAMAGRSDNPMWGNVSEAMPESIGSGRILDPIFNVAKSMFWDLPKRAIDQSVQNPQPGLRREDYTDVPPDTTPDAKSAFGGVGVVVPRVGWQPVDPMVGSSLEAASNVMGGTALTAPAAALGAGPVRRAAKAGLEMGEAERLARAAEQGFDTSKTWYHSALQPIEQFDQTGKFMGRSGTSGIHLTDNPQMASRYLDRYGEIDYKGEPFNKNIMPVYVRPGNVLERQQPFPTNLPLGAPIPPGFVSPVERAGYDALVRPDAISGRGGVKHVDPGTRGAITGNEMILTDPSRVRSIHAAFDPANKDKGFLLGAGATDKRAAGVSVLDDIDGLLEAERKLAGASDGRPPTAAAGPAAAPDPAAMGPGGGGATGVRSLPEAQAAAARWAGERAPLEGLPGPLKIGEDFFVPGPIGKIHDVAEDFMRTVHPDRPYTPPTKYHPIDPEHSQAIAKAYEEMKHTPNDPATKASYDALIDETAKQYDAIKKTGLKIEPVPAGTPDPYAANPRLAAVDVAENNHLWFFPTESGFGTVNKITDNPMLRKTGEKIGNHEMLANDMFRVVHDYFGHLKQGHGFRAAGEDNAWRTHAQMYSDLARPAMTTETRGQNSWVNYGPYGEKNRTASGADTVYADQKVGLMPEWTMRDRGSLPPIMVYHGSPHYFRRADISKIGTGEGNQAYGHGLYFAGHEPVSEWYRHQLATRSDPLLKKYKLEDVGHVIGAHLSDAGGDAAKLAGEYRKLRDRLIEGGETDKATKNMILDYDRRIDYLNNPKRSTGHMYQFGIDVPPEKLLDYDAPFIDQSQHVQGRVGPEMDASVKHKIEAINKSLDKGGRGDPSSKYFRRFSPTERQNLEGRQLLLEQTGHSSFPGKEIYKRMGLPAATESEGAVRASQRLLGMDVPGLRYKDAGSRAPGQQGSHNFVMFGDNMLRLLKQYGVVGIPAAGVLGLDGEERRARGGRVARRLARKNRAGGGAAFGVMSPAEEAELDEPAPIKITRALAHGLGDVAKRSFESSESMRRGDGYDPGPVLEVATIPMGTGAVAGVHAGARDMILGAGPVRRIADDTGAAMTAARKAKSERMYAEPEYTSGGNLITNKGVESPPNPMVQTVADPYRMMYPGVYRNPRILAEEAAARVGPEDEAMKRLFGVTRGDLREMSKGRVGNEDPRLNLAKNPKGSLAAQNIQTPQNTQRLVDILGEAGKHEGLRTADAWYNMDPVFKRMVELFGPDEAVKRYQKFNTTTAMASPGSDVMTEIQRGTAAHWLQNQGRFDDFKKFAGVPEEFRSRTAHFPADMRYIGGHPYHRTSQSDPMQKYFDAGSIQSKEPKVPLYTHASGTPETGFQTSGPVGDAHFSRGVGPSDTRKGPTDVQGSFSRAEYQTLQPWWQYDVAGKVGLESVPGQARLWTALGPQTGVDSALGAPKLELLAQQIMVAAKRLRISPEQARDLILSGNAGAGMLGGAVAAPVVAGAMRDHQERAGGGSVDAAMAVARDIKRAKGGRVHVGPIVGNTGGRADKRPMEVPDGSYVLTADHVSGLGEGNTEAGMKKLAPMFPNSKPSKLRGLKGKAVPIYAADGEFVIHPDDIVDRFGELDYGHRSLDAWQTTERKQLIKTLKNLAPPAQD